MIPWIICVVLLGYGVFITSKFLKAKKANDLYIRSLKNEVFWHEDGRQDVTDKPYSLYVNGDDHWINGPGLTKPAYLPSGKGKSINVRDLMNHAYRHGKP